MPLNKMLNVADFIDLGTIAPPMRPTILSRAPPIPGAIPTIPPRITMGPPNLPAQTVAADNPPRDFGMPPGQPPAEPTATAETVPSVPREESTPANEVPAAAAPLGPYDARARLRDAVKKPAPQTEANVEMDPRLKYGIIAGVGALGIAAIWYLTKGGK